MFCGFYIPSKRDICTFPKDLSHSPLHSGPGPWTKGSNVCYFSNETGQNFFRLSLSNPHKWERDLWLNKLDLLSVRRNNFSLIVVDKETENLLAN